MIINSFPPSGGSGVQRPLKFLKYSCHTGWEVHAIVPKKPTNTIIDYSLLAEIPAEAHIHKVRGLGIKIPEYAKITVLALKKLLPKILLKDSFGV
ncbi:MAG TPA: hypothetical protein PK015_04630 [Candidatus Syntrophosphaera thermopropionivorans]|nr:hypothetical protein [Candidatus Syntrophosphaera thermopropionivorans]